MSEVPEFVLFRPQDYAPVARRIGSYFVDLAFVFLILLALVQLGNVLFVRADIRAMTDLQQQQKLRADAMAPLLLPLFGTWLLFVVVYHLALWRTQGGTLGFRLLGIRLIDAAGKIPSWKQLIKRLSLAFGTMFVTAMAAVVFARLAAASYPRAQNAIAMSMFLFFVMAYFPCRRHLRRQTFHDQWSGTWLIRKNAQPAGPARPVYHTKMLGIWILTYLDLDPLEVARPAAQPSSSIP